MPFVIFQQILHFSPSALEVSTDISSLNFLSKDTSAVDVIQISEKSYLFAKPEEQTYAKIYNVLNAGLAKQYEILWGNHGFRKIMFSEKSYLSITSTPLYRQLAVSLVEVDDKTTTIEHLKFEMWTSGWRG